MKYYNPSEHLAVDKVTVFFIGRLSFKQYTPKRHKRFSIKIFKLCDSTVYTYDMNAYLVKYLQHMTIDVTGTYATVMDVTRRVEGQGRMFLVFPDLFENLTKKNHYSYILSSSCSKKDLPHRI
jgi:hypothetical protein